MTRRKWTRREVLGTGAAALAVPYLVPGSVLGRDGTAPAGETDAASTT